ARSPGTPVSGELSRRWHFRQGIVNGSPWTRHLPTGALRQLHPGKWCKVPPGAAVGRATQANGNHSDSRFPQVLGRLDELREIFLNGLVVTDSAAVISCVKEWRG